MKPSLAHSPSWVCRLRGVIWRRSASSRPLQSRWGSVAMRAVTRWRRVGGRGGRGPGGGRRSRWGTAGVRAGAGGARGRHRRGGVGGGEGEVERGDGGGGGGVVVVEVGVPGGGDFDLAGAVAGGAGGQQGGQDGPADRAGQVGGAVWADAGGGGELVSGGFHRGGEAGPVRVGARAGLDGGDHSRAQQLGEGEQGPGLLFQAGPVA